MRIEHETRVGLTRERIEESNQQRVLEAVREIACVIGVTVVHPTTASSASSGHRGRALTSIPSLQPSRSRSTPAQATITALSLQSLTGGATKRNPFDTAALAKPARTDALDATPPATTNRSAARKTLAHHLHCVKRPVSENIYYRLLKACRNIRALLMG